MEHTPQFLSLSLLSSWYGVSHRTRLASLGALLRMAGFHYLTQPRVGAMSDAWLRQHEVESDKRGIE
jgi:hypothetical protein